MHQQVSEDNFIHVNTRRSSYSHLDKHNPYNDKITSHRLMQCHAQRPKHNHIH